ARAPSELRPSAGRRASSARRSPPRASSVSRRARAAGPRVCAPPRAAARSTWAGAGRLRFRRAFRPPPPSSGVAPPPPTVTRTVRVLLAALRDAGVPAAYFGRDTIDTARRPVALLGLDQDASGQVVLEALVSSAGSFVVPAELAAETERATDRMRGRAPL